MNRITIFGIGLVIGLVLLALAGMAFYTAFQWGQIDRDGAMVGWNVVGFFLTVAGIGSIASTANHAFRVLAPDASPPSH